MSNSHAGRLIRNSILTLLNNLVGMALGLAVSILTARLLGPEQYGIYNIILWSSSLALLVIGMGLNFAATKFASELHGKNDKESMGSILRYILWIEGVLAVISTFLLIAQRNRIADYFFTPDYGYVFALCFAGLLPGIITAMYSSALEGLQKFHYFLYFGMAMSPLSLGAKVIVLLQGGGLEGLLWVNLVFSGINMVFYRWALYRERVPASLLGPFPPKPVRTKILRYNWSISAIMMLDKVVWDKSENFFLGRFSTASQAGLFNMAYGLSGKFTTIISSTFWKVLFPFMSERAGAHDTHRLERVFHLSTRYLAFLAFPMGAAGMVLSWPLIKYALGPEYLGAQRSLQIFFFCSLFTHLAVPQASVLYAVEKQNFIVRWGAILAALNLLLDFLIIPTHGATGAAAVNGGTRVLAFIGGILYTVRVTKVRLPLKSLFKILYSATLMALLMQVVIKLNNELLGFIISIPLGCIVYLGTCIFMGTFEKEDAVLWRKLLSYFPAVLRRPLLFIISRMESSRPHLARES